MKHKQVQIRDKKEQLSMTWHHFLVLMKNDELSENSLKIKGNVTQIVFLELSPPRDGVNSLITET